jgi:hypothetical protein
VRRGEKESGGSARHARTESIISLPPFVKERREFLFSAGDNSVSPARTWQRGNGKSEGKKPSFFSPSPAGRRSGRRKRPLFPSSLFRPPRSHHLSSLRPLRLMTSSSSSFPPPTHTHFYCIQPRKGYTPRGRTCKKVSSPFGIVPRQGPTPFILTAEIPQKWLLGEGARRCRSRLLRILRQRPFLPSSLMCEKAKCERGRKEKNIIAKDERLFSPSPPQLT